MGAGDWFPETTVLGALSTEDNVEVDAAAASYGGSGEEVAFPAVSEWLVRRKPPVGRGGKGRLDADEDGRELATDC